MVMWIRKNLLLLVILMLAVFLRTVKLDYLELFGDEIDAGYQSYSLLETGSDYKGHQWPFYMQSFSEWRAPGFMYAMVPFIRIFGLNEWGVRLTSAFFGITLIVAWYWLLTILRVEKKTKLVNMLLLSILPWQVQYSRSGYELTLMTSALIIGTAYWIKAQESKHHLFTILSGMFYSVAIYTYNTANIYVPLIVLSVVLCFGVKPKKILLLFLLGLTLCLPLINNVVQGEASARFKLFSVWGNKEVNDLVVNLRNETKVPISRVFYNKLTQSVKVVVFNYTNAFSSNFLFYQGDVTFRHSLHQVGNMYWLMAPFILFGLYLVARKGGGDIADKFMLLIMLISPIPASLTVDGYNHASRLFILSLPLVYLAAKGFSKVGKYVSFVAVLVLMFEFANFQFFYWNNYRIESWRWWHAGYKETMLAIAENKSNYSRVLIDNTYEPSLIRYVFWNKVNPIMIRGVVDQMNSKIDGYYDGFKLPESNVYFVDFKGPIRPEMLKKNTLYVFSQDKNVMGTRDLEVTKPDNSLILKTVRNYSGLPIFYLVTKE